jgi:1,4-dihydroxy-2-naphthoate octaprenyltransferase
MKHQLSATAVVNRPQRRVLLRFWLEASRPRMFSVWLQAALVPGAVAWLNRVFDPLTFFLELLLCCLLLTLSCWADEYGDYRKGVDNAGRLGPIRPVQRGDIPLSLMLKACGVLALACFILGVVLVLYASARNGAALLVIPLFIAVGTGCIVAAFCYTIGKRPYGYRGLGDLVAWFFFGPVAGLGGYLLYDFNLDWSLLAPVSATGLLLVLTINLQNLRDFENDRAHGKRSTAVCLGFSRALRYHYALIVAAMLLYVLFPVVKGMTDPLNYLFVIAFAPLVSHMLRFGRSARTWDMSAGLVQAQARALDALMWPLTRGMGILAVAFSLCVCL